VIDFVATFIFFFAVIDPIGTVPVFIAVTRQRDSRTKRRIAVVATLASAGILVFFVAAGEVILTMENLAGLYYGVTFTMIAPSHVKGPEATPVFRELANQTQAPSWNFNKYLVDGSGKVIQHFGSNTRPDSKVLQAAIESVL